MSYMFFEAVSFNQPVEGWNTANVTNMCCTFKCASSFNQSLEGWNAAKVIDTRNMLPGPFWKKPSWLKK